MSEQREPHDVIVYCDQCARRYGSRRLLAAADREPRQWPDGWGFWLGRRAGRGVRITDGGYLPRVTSAGGRPHGERKRVGPVLQPGGHRFVLVPLDPHAPAAQLICYKCPARPRLARARLMELVEQTIAAGRRDAYA